MKCQQNRTKVQNKNVKAGLVRTVISFFFFFPSAFSLSHRQFNSPEELNNKEQGLGKDRAGQGPTCTYSKQRFVIGWENNRDCDITMALSLKTMGSAGWMGTGQSRDSFISYSFW